MEERSPKGSGQKTVGSRQEGVGVKVAAPRVVRYYAHVSSAPSANTQTNTPDRYAVLTEESPRW